MKFDIPIPEQLRHLPRDERGYPIPYFVPYEDGKPLFHLLDTAKQLTCIKYAKCAICGKQLKKGEIYFITGPQGLYNAVATDPGMHLICAEFSIRVCPHMVYFKATRRPDPRDEQLQLEQYHMAREKPTELYLIRAKGYTTSYQYSALVISYEVLSWHRYFYQDNILVKDETPQGKGGKKFELSEDQKKHRASIEADILLKAALQGKSKK